MALSIRKLGAVALMMLSASVFAAPSNTVEEKGKAPGVKETKVLMKTSMGDIVLKLDDAKAPITVKNFLQYVDDGFYNDLIFHRVIPGFMIQGGGMNKNMNQKAARAPIKNESSNGLSNRRGTISMARLPAPDSASSQFFINLVNNNRLDYRSGQPGYAVFGEVVEGMDVVDRIGSVKRGRKGPYSDVPVDTVTILKVERLSKPEPAKKK